MNIKEGSVVLIQTYLFQSGLWYLAKSLADELIKRNCIIYFIPKPKYTHDSGRFIKNIIISEDKEFSEYNICNLNLNDDYERVNRAMIKYKPDYFISFETLTTTISHLMMIKNKYRRETKFIDVPMIEWVVENDFNNNTYKLFDEVWCLTEQCYNIFKEKYDYSKYITWNFVDNSLFNKNKKKSKTLTFYHQGSLNPDFSSKNTDKVIKAFSKLIEGGHDAKLKITADIKDKSLLNIIEKYRDNIILLNNLSRQEIADLMKEAHFLVAPSSNEGLGIHLFEAEACGCRLIITDKEPLNEHKTEYLCKADHLKKSGLSSVASVSVSSIYEQILKAANDWNK